MYGKALVGLGSLIAIAGGMVTFEDRYAKDRDLQLVAGRLHQQILIDRIHQVENRLWKFEDKYGPGCVKAERIVKEECQKLMQRLEDLKREYRGQK